MIILSFQLSLTILSRLIVSISIILINMVLKKRTIKIKNYTITSEISSPYSITFKPALCDAETQ